MLLNVVYLCYHGVQPPLSPGIIPWVRMQHSRPDDKEITLIKMARRLQCDATVTSSYHESGGEPGTPELANRPVRNCCTILRDTDKISNSQRKS